MVVLPIFQEVASSHKEGLLLPRVGGLIDTLKALRCNSKDVEGLLSLHELQLVQLSYKLRLILDLSGVELVLLLNEE